MAAISTTPETRSSDPGTGLPSLAAPFPSHPGRVRPEWIDHNGHLNLAYYIVLFDEATDALWDAIGLGRAYRARTGLGTFAVETHTLYLGELTEGDDTRATSLVVGLDAKRIHVAHELRRVRGDAISARQELVYLTVDLATRRSVSWPAETLACLQGAHAVHAGMCPEWVGRRCAIPAPKPTG